MMNRVYLLSALILSMILPLITLHYRVAESSDSMREIFNGSVMQGRTTDPVNTGLSSFSSLATAVYLTGVFIFLTRILWQLLMLLRIISKSTIRMDGKTTGIENDRLLLPCSIMKMIFINPKYIRDAELADIITHEKVHIRENHWFDLFIVEVITIFMWFNPFIWFFERSIKQNHEYLADKGVIAQGCSVGRYHSVLINQLMGMEVIGITNNLNYSLNAKRLKMMKRKKTPKTRALRILWSLPVVLLLLVAFAQPEYEKNESFSDSSEKVKISCSVYDSNGDPITGAKVVVKGSDKSTVTDKEGKFSLDVETGDILVVEYKGYEKSVIHMGKLAEKDGKSDSYILKIKMKPLGNETVDYDANSEIKDLETILKKIALKQEELNNMKQKISQAEKEGKIPEEELTRKKAELKKEYLALEEKKAEVVQKIKQLKK